MWTILVFFLAKSRKIVNFVVQAFPGQRMYELIRPLVKLLHIDCSALENFEALLALTNITHVSASVVDKIVKDKHLEKIEHYMYEGQQSLRSVRSIQSLLK